MNSFRPSDKEQGDRLTKQSSDVSFLPKKAGFGSLPRLISQPISAASDGLAAANTGHGHGLHQAFSVAEGGTGASSLLHEGRHHLSKVAPRMNNSIGAMAQSSNAAGVAGKALGFASKAAPFAWAGNMALQGVDVAMDPAKNLAETQQVANKGVAGRAWHGFANPIKTIAGAGQMLGEIGKLNFQNSAYEAARNPGQINQNYTPTYTSSATSTGPGLPSNVSVPIKQIPQQANQFQPVGQPFQKKSNVQLPQLQTSIPNETPENLYNRIVSRKVNVDQFFNNATKHSWDIPGIPGFLARTVARKAEKNPDPYLKSLVDKVPKNRVIDAIKRNPDAFKNVSNKITGANNVA